MNVLLYGLVVMIWGTTWIAIVMQQGTVAITVSIFWRFLLAALAMLALLTLTRRLRQISLRDHLFCLLQGCCVFSFNFVCFYQAASFISSGLESVIFSMAVLFNAFNSLLFFRQRPHPNLLPAALLGIGGVIALFWHDLLATQLAPSLLYGIGLSALGTFGFSLGNMISTRHQRRGLETLSTNTYAMFYGALIMAIISLGRGDNFAPELTTRYLGALVYLAIFGSVIAFGAYFTLVGRIGAGPAAYSTLLFPLVALAMSTLFEGYRWHSNAVIGLAMILLGNAVMFRPPGRVPGFNIFRRTRQDKAPRSG
ncbi:EamA family transporter [Paramixta manurensis]|uniref:EamA family transporter n=1 Tax=Paramixta manurensis TaxID=2740817 RepID=A0A6M8UK04_9GAMM|nr:EamA family transporter [Erwiniaceae bacterium PD-1]